MHSVITQMMQRITDLERRIDGSLQRGKVEEVDPAAGTVRIRLGGDDDEPFLSPPIPYAQFAGDLKVHTPPSVGQTMTVMNAGGDYRQGIAMPLSWSDQNATPSERGDENVLTYGNVTLRIADGQVTISVGENAMLAMMDGAIILKATEIITDGITRLNKGTRGVVFRGSLDSDGGNNIEGADDVYV